MSWRKIVVDGHIYRWKCGDSNVSIRNDKTNKGVNIAISELKPLSPEALEEMHWHEGGDGVTPNDVRAYIIGNLLDEELGLRPIRLHVLQEVFFGRWKEYYFSRDVLIVNNFGPPNTKTFSFSVGKGKSDEEDCWIALNYLKFNPKGMQFEAAAHVLKVTPGFRKTAAKAMLKGF